MSAFIKKRANKKAVMSGLNIIQKFYFIEINLK